MSERWKAVPGFEGYYEASTLGRIRRLARFVDRKLGSVFFYNGGLLPGNHHDQCGYCVVALSAGRTRWSTRVHRVIATTFLPNPDDLPEVEHKDHNRSNNRLSNLEWISRPNNVAKGERVCGAKLSAGQVEHIRGLLASGFKQRQIAVMFGIDPSAVSNIKTRRNWKHI